MIHFIAKKIKNLCIKVNYRWKSFHERRKLQYIDFSIISNNCWAGFVYSKFGLEYTTPTIGMGIVDDDYIKFLENMDYYSSNPQLSSSASFLRLNVLSSLN